MLQLPKSETAVCIGFACHDTIALARLGIGVSFSGRVGADETGERICAELSGEGGGVAGRLRTAEERTGLSVIIVNPATGQRSNVRHSGPAVTMTLTIDELDARAAAEWTHAD